MLILKMRITIQGIVVTAELQLLNFLKQVYALIVLIKEVEKLNVQVEKN